MFRMKDKSLHGVEADKLRKNFWTYVVLLSALGAMTFFGVCTPGGSSFVGPSGSAAKVADEVITRNEFNRAYRNAYDRSQRQYRDDFDPARFRLAHTVMKELVDDRAIYVKSVEYGLRASDDEIIAILREENTFKDDKGQFSADAFKNYLDSQGYTEASFMEEIRRSLTVQKFQKLVRDSVYVSSKAAEIDYRLAETKLNLEYLKFDPQKIEVTVSKEEIDKLLADEAGKKRVKDYYDSNKKEFNAEEQVKARHILVAFQGARNAPADGQKRSKDEAKARAAEILSKAKTAGTDFVALAKESTDEAAGKASGGDLGFKAREAMGPEMAQAAFALKPGEITEVVESPFGFHIIKVEERKEAKSVKLEEAERGIAENFLRKEKRPSLAKEQADKVVAELREGRDIQPLLTQYKVSWAETGEVAMNAGFIPGIGTSKEVANALASLSKPGEVTKVPLDVRGNLYVLRLKSKAEADVQKLTPERRRELAQSQAFSEGFAIYRVVERQLTDELEKKHKIWMNPEYLSLDTPKDKGQAEGQPSS